MYVVQAAERLSAVLAETGNVLGEASAGVTEAGGLGGEAGDLLAEHGALALQTQAPAAQPLQVLVTLGGGSVLRAEGHHRIRQTASGGAGGVVGLELDFVCKARGVARERVERLVQLREWLDGLGSA